MIDEYLMEENDGDIIYRGFSKLFDTLSHYNLRVKMKKQNIRKKIVFFCRYNSENKNL